jgi:hypothetical protein
MTIFSQSVFDASVTYEGYELFKGNGAASGWASKLATEIKTEVTVKKLGSGWALYATYEGEECIWGIHGQRLCRIN